MRDRTVGRDGERPELRVASESALRLQPLRVAAQWHVVYNQLFAVDPCQDTVSAAERDWDFKEDILYLEHARLDRMLDVGWHPHGDVVAGEYKLVVHEGDFWGRFLRDYRTRSLAELVAEIERLLLAIAAGEL